MEKEKKVWKDVAKGTKVSFRNKEAKSIEIRFETEAEQVVVYKGWRQVSEKQ